MLTLYLSLVDSPDEKRKFEKLYTDYKQTMFYAANRILKDSYEAEDAVHQAFLRIINHLDKIDENDHRKTKAFLIVVVENISIDIYRKRKHDNILLFDELEVDIPINNFNEEWDEVTIAISKLPINYSTVLKLRYSQGYDENEIAQILNITINNVRQRIFRAKQRLSQMLNIKEEVDNNE